MEGCQDGKPGPIPTGLGPKQQINTRKGEPLSFVSVMVPHLLSFFVIIFLLEYFNYMNIKNKVKVGDGRLLSPLLSYPMERTVTFTALCEPIKSC